MSICMLVVVTFGLFSYMYGMHEANLNQNPSTQSVMLADLNNFCQVNRLFRRQLSVALFHWWKRQLKIVKKKNKKLKITTKSKIYSNSRFTCGQLRRYTFNTVVRWNCFDSFKSTMQVCSYTYTHTHIYMYICTQVWLLSLQAIFCTCP